MLARLFLAGAMICVAISPVQADAEPPVIHDWSGFYVGAHAGSGWGTSDGDQEIGAGGGRYNAAAATWGYDIDGVMAGGQLGFNLQSGAIVYGLEGDIGYLGLEGDGDGGPTSVETVSSVDGGFYATATGRLGYAADRLLLYIKGGAAFADLDVQVRDPSTTVNIGIIDADNKGTEIGWTLGGGAEWALSEVVSLKLEYLFMNFNDVKSKGEAFNPGPAGQFGWKHDIEIHAVKAGINFYF